MRGATYVTRGHIGVANISIHAPREGCDLGCQNKPSESTEFQSTHPVRGATFLADTTNISTHISIHAPREGCDYLVKTKIPLIMTFQSTHPVRGATTVLPQ